MLNLICLCYRVTVPELERRKEPCGSSFIKKIKDECKLLLNGPKKLAFWRINLPLVHI